MDIGAIEGSGGLEGLASQDNIKSLVAKIIEQLDQDGDGQLSAEEASFPQEMMSQIDHDGDGSLNQSEMAEGITSIKDFLFNLGDYASILSDGEFFDMETFQSMLGGMSGAGGGLGSLLNQ